MKRGLVLLVLLGCSAPAPAPLPAPAVAPTTTLAAAPASDAAVAPEPPPPPPPAVDPSREPPDGVTPYVERRPLPVLQAPRYRVVTDGLGEHAALFDRTTGYLSCFPEARK